MTDITVRLVTTQGRTRIAEGGPTGKRGTPTFREAWSAATAYVAGDGVTRLGSYYGCILEHTNQAPPNATYWALIASKGDTGATGTTGATGATGATGPQGVSTLTTVPVISANATAAILTLIPVDLSGGNVVLTLPTAPADESPLTVRIVAVSAGATLTITAGGTDVLQLPGGPSSLSYGLLYEAIECQYDAGTDVWHLLSQAPTQAYDTRYAPASIVVTAHDPGAYYGNGVLSTFTHVHGLDHDWVTPFAWNTVTREPEDLQWVSIDTTSVQVTVLDVPGTNGLHIRCSR